MRRKEIRVFCRSGVINVGERDCELVLSVDSAKELCESLLSQLSLSDLDDIGVVYQPASSDIT